MTPSDFFDALAGMFRAIRPAPEPVVVLPRRRSWSTLIDMNLPVHLRSASRVPSTDQQEP